MTDEAARELLEVCKAWTVCLAEGWSDERYQALYRRMCDAIDAADPDYWVERE